MTVENIAAWFQSYWPYAVALVVVAAGTAFICRKAVLAYRTHQKTFHTEEARLRRLSELKERYGALTPQIIADAPPEDLLEGVALRDRLLVEKAPRMEPAFRALPKERQYLYALDVFLADRTAKTFFTQNGSILVSIIAPAMEMIGVTDVLPTVKKLALMFDENDESTSVDHAFLDRADEIFSEADLLTQIKLQGAQYIKQNPAIFCEKQN